MYTARIPFLTPPTSRISEQEATLDIANVRYVLKWDGYYHVLVATGLPSEDEAKKFITLSRAAFAWLLLQKGIAAEADLVPQEIRYYDDPIQAGANIGRSFGGKPWDRVDTILQGSQPAVYPTNKQVKVATALPATIHTTIPSAQALETLVQGTIFPSSSRIAGDQKLAVALDLYGAYFSEQSAKARFLTLIMALETLALATLKPELALQLLSKWQLEVNVLKEDQETAEDDKASLESLERELLFRREDSIRSQIRKLVRETLTPADDAELTARSAVKLYDLRSRLVHEGTVDQLELDQATGQAKGLVQKVLAVRFERLTQPRTK